MKDWQWSKRRRVMIGGHIPDYDQLPGLAFGPDRESALAQYRGLLAKADPRAMVREIKRTGAQVLYYYSKCHYGNAYYPSRVPGAHVHSALDGRDLFGEFTRACLDVDLVPCAVYEFSDMRLPMDHPDWCHCSSEAEDPSQVDVTEAHHGTKIEGGCLNGPYGDYAIGQAVEVVRNYPIQGYYVDYMGMFGPMESWVCPYCRPVFEEEFGFPFRGIGHLTPDQVLQYRDWWYRQYDAYAKKFLAAIRAVRPDIVFTHNFFGMEDDPGQAEWAMAADHCDFMSKDVFSLRGGSLRISWTVKALGECSRKAPAEVLLDTPNGVSGDFYTPKPLDAYRGELWTARCSGLATCASIMHTPDAGMQDRNRPILAMIKKVFDEQQAYEPWLEAMQPLAEVAIWRSRHTIEARPQEGEKSGDNSGRWHAREFYGWCEVLISSHRLWTVLQDHHITDRDLARFRVLVLPDATSLSDAQCAAIERFVKRGGVVIATGETSLLTPTMDPRKDFGLHRVLGVHALGGRRPDWRTLIIGKGPLKPTSPWETPMLYLNAGQWPVKAGRACDVFATAGAWPFSGLTTDLLPTEAPALTRHRFGKGAGWYFAGLPGFQYHGYGQHSVRKLMAQVLDRALGRRTLLTVDGPATLECFAHTRPGKEGAVVSLVNVVSSVTRTLSRSFAQRKHDMVDETPRVSEAHVTLRPPAGSVVRRVRLAPTGRSLRLDRTGNAVRVALKDLDVLTMLEVEFAAR